jgi:hypothetical protein
MDIFDNKDITRMSKRKRKRSIFQRSQRPQSEIYIRMVLPAEQTTAIAKSMLERQAKPKDVSIVGQKEIQTTREKLKRQNSKADDKTRKSKKPRQDPLSIGRKRKEKTGELDNITTIGQVLS